MAILRLLLFLSVLVLSHLPAYAAPISTPTPGVPAPVTMVLQFAYDGAGRRTVLQVPDGSQQQYGYDNAGRIKDFVQLGGGTDSLHYDGAGNLIKVNAANGGVQQWGYDAAGRLDSTSWQAG